MRVSAIADALLLRHVFEMRVRTKYLSPTLCAFMGISATAASAEIVPDSACSTEIQNWLEDDSVLPEHFYVACHVKVGPAGRMRWGEEAVTPKELAIRLRKAGAMSPSTLLVSVEKDADCEVIQLLRTAIEKNFDCKHNDCRLSAPLPDKLND